MKKWLRFTGLLGLVVFMFGLVGSLLVRSFTQPLMLAHLGGGLALLVLWLVLFGLEGLRESKAALVGRQVRFGLQSALYSAGFIGLLIIVNWVAARNDYRWDLTEQKIFSLSTHSIKALERLKKPLKITLFMLPRQFDQQKVKDLLQLYRSYAPDLLTTVIIDPVKNPRLVEKLNMKTGQVVHLSYGSGSEALTTRINEINEEDLTNAILKLARGQVKKLYYVQGHGEPDLNSSRPDGLRKFAQALNDEHIILEGIILAEHGSVPADAAGVVLASPSKPLLERAKTMLLSFVENGGGLVLLYDPVTAQAIPELAAHFGIEVGKNVVLDQVQRFFDAPELGWQVVVRDYGLHDITKPFKAGDVTVYLIVATVSAPAVQHGAGVYTELLKTGASAWAETNLEQLFGDPPRATLDPGQDTPGPLSLAVVYERELGRSKQPTAEQQRRYSNSARLIVFGDTEWIRNVNLDVYANRDLILNVVQWLTRQEQGISIRPKSMRHSVAPLTRKLYLYLLSLSFVVPELILILGLFVWWRRKVAR